MRQNQIVSREPAGIEIRRVYCILQHHAVCVEFDPADEVLSLQDPPEMGGAFPHVAISSEDHDAQ